MSTRRKYSSKMKAEIVLKAIRAENISAIAREYGIRNNLISKWKKQLIQSAPKIFDNAPDKQEERLQKKIKKLEQIIGQKEIELSLMRNFINFYDSPNGE
jgi:transposase